MTVRMPISTAPGGRTIEAEARFVSDDPLDWKRRGLSARSRRVCLSLCEALYSDEDDRGAVVPAEAALCERAVDAFDAAIGRSSADVRRGFGVLTLAVDLLPLLVIGVFTRMRSLSVEGRVAYLDALEHSRVGLFAMLFVAFKVPMSIPAFEEGELLASTGFDRPSTASRRRLPVSRDEAARTKVAS